MDESAWSSGRCFLSAATSGVAPIVQAMRAQSAVLPKGPLRHIGVKGGAAGSGEGASAAIVKPKVAMFNPNDPGAVVLSVPEKDGGSVAVVVDPYLSTHLRPHQVEGVTFLYRSVMGHNAREAGIEAGSHGAILADEVHPSSVAPPCRHLLLDIAIYHPTRISHAARLSCAARIVRVGKSCL
jgi:hypothetical protein